VQTAPVNGKLLLWLTLASPLLAASDPQVTVTGNMAGTPGNITVGASNTSAVNTSSSSSSSRPCSLSAVAKLSHFESGRLRNVTLSNNTGSIALDVNGFALAEPVENVLVADNAASGIRMVSTQPR
jgi:hypothetical protein